MCPHNKFEKVREKLRPFLSGWRVIDVMRCESCHREEDQVTDFMVYGRGKNEERHEIKKI